MLTKTTYHQWRLSLTRTDIRLRKMLPHRALAMENQGSIKTMYETLVRKLGAPHHMGEWGDGRYLYPFASGSKIILSIIWLKANIPLFKTEYSNPTTTSSTTHALHGTNSSTSPGGSCQSDCAIGRTNDSFWELV